LEVVPRHSKPLFPIESRIKDIPVVDSYRYLGVLFDNKLTGDKQIEFVNRKIHFLTSRLAPLLYKVSTDYKINLWKTLIRPLFSYTLPLMAHNNCTRVAKLERHLKFSFKKFVGLSITTEDKVLKKLIDFNVIKLAKEQEHCALNKWRQRLLRAPLIEKGEKKKEVCTPLLPKVFTRYNNIQKSRSKHCNYSCINSAEHLKKVHNLPVPPTTILIEELERDFPRSSKKPRPLLLKEREGRIYCYLSLILRHISLCI